jgi:hypothetical protein
MGSFSWQYWITLKILFWPGFQESRDPIPAAGTLVISGSGRETDPLLEKLSLGSGRLITERGDERKAETLAAALITATPNEDCDTILLNAGARPRRTAPRTAAGSCPPADPLPQSSRRRGFIFADSALGAGYRETRLHAGQRELRTRHAVHPRRLPRMLAMEMLHSGTRNFIHLTSSRKQPRRPSTPSTGCSNLDSDAIEALERP